LLAKSGKADKALVPDNKNREQAPSHRYRWRERIQPLAKCRFSIPFTDVTPGNPISRLISLVINCSAWTPPGWPAHPAVEQDSHAVCGASHKGFSKKAKKIGRIISRAITLTPQAHSFTSCLQALDASPFP
jgi:hypothetical protein